MNEYPRFLKSELPESRAEECFFHIIPVPYEASVSYGQGTANGPLAILEASSQLEVWTGRANPSSLGIYTAPPVDCGNNAGADSSASAPEVLEHIAAATNFSLKTGGLPILLGGEHSITPGALGALKDKYGIFGVVHFDAHADLRQTYQGSRYSHACAMRRAADLGLPIFQLGVRSLSPEEISYRKVSGIGHLDARELFQLGPQFGNMSESYSGTACPRQQTATAQTAKNPLANHAFLSDGFPDKIFVSFDVDALDPSILPATGTPEPGGLGWYQSLNLLEAACAGRQVIGADFVELAPKEGWPSSDFTVARLVYEFMGIVMPRG